MTVTRRVFYVYMVLQVIAVCPRLCPMSLAAALVSIGNDNGKEPDRLRRACVETLCELGKNLPVNQFSVTIDSTC